MLTITPAFAALLKKEGEKAGTICTSLNADPAFLSALTASTHGNYKNIVYKAEHILLRDLVRIYDLFAATFANPSQIPAYSKFILIYFYEKLQGRDLFALYDLTKLNLLPASNQFDKNITTIRSTSFFQSIEGMEEEFVMPALLTKIKSDQFLAMTALINRIASFLIKVDDPVNAGAADLLKQISQKVNNPKIALVHAAYNDIPENDTLEKVISELHGLTGMEEIKQHIEDITNFLKVGKIREEKGLKTAQTSLHTVFMGPPGTGKTTVARLLGRIFKHLGYIQRGHLVETDRAGMVAGYVGQTAIKSDEIIRTAIGGVLFIDEAYSLTSGNFNDFGREAVEILLKRMEDHRDNLVVIVAGYPEEIEMFIQSNPGLQSRFNRYLKFDHFKPEELLKIFKTMAVKADFRLTEDAEEKLKEILDRVYEKRGRSFGNARAMRNLFEKIIEKQANRIVKITPITEEILMVLTEEDIPDVLKAVRDLVVFDEEEEEEKK